MSDDSQAAPPPSPVLFSLPVIRTSHHPELSRGSSQQKRATEARRVLVYFVNLLPPCLGGDGNYKNPEEQDLGENKQNFQSSWKTAAVR